MALAATDYPSSTAAINWFDGKGGLHMRVYSSDGYTVTERCNDGQGWTTGQFNQPGSQVSATCWTTNGEPSIRLYCTADDVTTERCADPNKSAWYQGDYSLQ